MRIHDKSSDDCTSFLNAVFVYEALALSELIYESPIMRWFVLHWSILS